MKLWRVAAALLLIASAPAWGQGSISGNNGNGIGGNPPFGGGGGTPGGSNGFIQFNNGGTFGGIATTGTGNVVRSTSGSLTNPTISGGTIDGSAIGGTTPAAVSATTLSATGATTTAGIADSGGINTTAAASYSIRGNLAMAIYGTPGSNTSTVLGFGAGAALTTSAGQFVTFLGDSTGAAFVGGGGAGEVLCAGSLSCGHAIASTHLTALGIGSLWWETTGNFDTCVGSDSCRNSIGTNSNTGVGNAVMDAYFGSNSSAYGQDALFGNAAALQIIGTIAAGETMSGTLTMAGVAGSPFSWTYTTVSGDATPVTLAGHLCTASSAFGNINALPIGSFVCNASSVTLAGVAEAVVAFSYDGTSAIGNIITLTAATTGAETMTVTGGMTAGVINDCFGANCGAGLIMTTATNNVGFGHNVLQWMTTTNEDACGGYQACEFLTSGAQDSAWGFEAGQNMTTAFGVSLFGSTAGNAITSGQNDSFFGLNSGKLVTTGNNNDLFGRNSGAALTNQSGTSAFGDQAGLHATSNNGSYFGISAGSSITTGANNSIYGNSVASVTLTTGASNLIMGTSSACDAPTAATANEVIICGAAGPVWTATGTNTPSTSITTIAGIFNLAVLSTGTAATYACFTSGGQLISSATAC